MTMPDFSAWSRKASEIEDPSEFIRQKNHRLLVLLNKLKGREDREETIDWVLWQVVLNNLGLVGNKVQSVYSSYKSLCEQYTISKDDLFSAGMLGVREAAIKFELSKGFLFSTYARFDIWNHMRDLFREGKKQRQADISLDEKIYKEGDLTRVDIVPSESDTFEDAQACLDQKDIRRVWKKAVRECKFDNRTIGVLWRRFYMNQARPKIADHYKCSAENIRLIEVKALKVLRKHPEFSHLYDNYN